MKYLRSGVAEVTQACCLQRCASTIAALRLSRSAAQNPMKDVVNCVDDHTLSWRAAHLQGQQRKPGVSLGHGSGRGGARQPSCQRVASLCHHRQLRQRQRAAGCRGVALQSRHEQV